MSEAAAWYQKGPEGYARAQQIQEQQSSQYGPMRFFIKPGSSAKLTFLDTEGFYFNEHNLKINNKWGNYYTCRRDFSECPLCDAGEKAGYVCAYTIIDHSEWESKTGKLIKNQKKLLIVRPAVINKLARRREALDGSLRNALFMFSRDKKEECSTGEDIEFIKRLEVDDVLRFKPENMTEDEFLAPFDYMKLFAPKSVEELRRIVGQRPPVGADNYGSSDIPDNLSRNAEMTDEDDIANLL